MVRPERFELPTYSSGGCRSIQLSYGRAPLVYIGTGVCPCVMGTWASANNFATACRSYDQK